jgi:hypothetical protein
MTRLETLRKNYTNWTPATASRSGRGTEVYVSPDGTRVARIGWDKSYDQFAQIAKDNAYCAGLPKVFTHNVYGGEEFGDPWISVTEIERLYDIDPGIAKSLDTWMIDAAVTISKGQAPTTDPYGLVEALTITLSSLKALPPGESCSLDAQAKNVMVRKANTGDRYVWMDALD